MTVDITPRRRVPRAAWARSITVRVLLVSAALVLVSMLAPSAFGLSRYVVTGTSMSGSYDRGSVVFDELVAADDLRVGDVVTYTPPPRSGLHTWVTHRIVSIEDGMVRTKGDANPRVDPWTVPAVQVEQRVVAGVPVIGHVFLALSDPATRYAAMVLPILVVALLALADWLNERSQTRRRSVATTEQPAPVAGPVAVPAPRSGVEPGLVRP